MDAQHDPTFYRTPADAIAAPAERLAYVVAFDRSGIKPDALHVVDVDPGSSSYGQVVGVSEMPGSGDELHHFGWNACSSALLHEGHHGPSRRYLIVPGLRSSRLHVFDTAADPRHPELVKVIEADELAAKAGYSRPHTLHCGPDGLFLTCLGGGNGEDGPGGIALLDHDTFDVLGPWERDRGPQYLAYDAWWHLNQNTLVSSEWGTPSMIENGLDPELLLGRKYGHALHFWDLAADRHLQTVDLGDEHQMALELRPAHDPNQTWGFAGVVVIVADLSASVWRWHREGDRWTAGDHDPGRAGRPGGAAPDAAGLRRGPAAGHRHQPVRRRPLAVRLLLGHRRAAAVRRVRPRAPPQDRLGAPGRHHRPRAAPRRARRARRPAARRWSRSAAMAAAST